MGAKICVLLNCGQQSQFSKVRREFDAGRVNLDPPMTCADWPVPGNLTLLHVYANRIHAQTVTPEPNLPQNVRFTPNTTVTKPSKSSSESESSVYCCCAAVKTRQNSKEWSLKLDQNETILPELRQWKSPTCAEIICDHCRKRPRMQRHRFMCPITETMEHGVENLQWRSSLKPVEAGVSGRLGSRYRAP